MERIQTRALVESAIFAGITVILGILYYYTQYLGIIALVWPVPVVIVGYRNGLKASILSAMSAGLIVSVLTHPLVGVGLLVGFGLPGILMGYMIKKRMSPYAVVVLCGLVISFTAVGELWLSLKAAGIDMAQMFASMESTFKQQMEATLNIYRNMGISEKDLQNMSEFTSQTFEMMKLIFPSGIVISSMLFSFIDYKLARLILKRIGHVIKDVENFSKWRLQEPYSFILLGLAVFAMAVSYFNLSGLKILAMNIFTLLMLFFTVIGVSVIMHFSGVYGDKYGIPKALRAAIIVFIIFTFLQFITFIGILDMMFNFRKLEPENRFGGVR